MPFIGDLAENTFLSLVNNVRWGSGEVMAVRSTAGSFPPGWSFHLGLEEAPGEGEGGRAVLLRPHPSWSCRHSTSVLGSGREIATTPLSRPCV